MHIFLGLPEMVSPKRCDSHVTAHRHVGACSRCGIGECGLAGNGRYRTGQPWDPMTAHAAPGMVWLDGRFELGASGRYGNDETSLWQVGAYDAQTTRVGFGSSGRA